MPYGWHSLLAQHMDGGLRGLVKGVDPHARVIRVDDSRLAWKISIDELDNIGDEPLSVQVAKGTVLYQTRLKDHIPLLQL
jgi:hypothetical protein